MSDQVIEKKKKKLWPKIVIGVGVLLVGLVIGFLFYLPSMIMNEGFMFGHFATDVKSASEYGVEAETLRLTTDDSLEIEAYLVQADAPKGTVILTSGIHNPSVTAFFGYARMLQHEGWNSLLVEQRAHGNSEGDMICFSMKEWLDVKAGVDYLVNQTSYGQLPIVVWGTSMGASTAINAIGEIDEIDGLISFSAFSSFEDVCKEYMHDAGMPSFLCDIEMPFFHHYLKSKVGKQYININAKNEIKKLNGRPALIMHSTEDSQVYFENYKRIMKNAPSYVETYVKEGDFHFIFDENLTDTPEKDTEVSKKVLDFLEKNFVK